MPEKLKSIRVGKNGNSGDEQNSVQNAQNELESDNVSSMVNHPAHYTQGAVECIEAIKAATQGLTGVQAFCIGNAIKYLWRFNKKGSAMQDLEKAIWYIERAKGEIQ